MQKISVGIFGPGHGPNQHGLIFYWALTQPGQLGPAQETGRLGPKVDILGPV